MQHSLWILVLGFIVWGGMAVGMLGIALYILLIKRSEEPNTHRLFWAGLSFLAALGFGLIGKSQCLDASWKTSVALRWGAGLLIFVLLPSWDRWLKSRTA